ncbi:aspartate carbamoyltransferase regulatory subunit [Anaerovorax odorimutans]|uniref:aspartate carbamoyltransferase regulatory subunit n=1 Tax=Anaerovorax odorimutans TaxID=109327 RepID=UPI0004033ECC|nr:aspartate carbamoyltransferase regulatory subunit [Anaerovorax odorimutans]
MVVINSIEKGIVIDHIKAGFGVKILDYLNIDASKGTVAFIMNATSNKYGRKDVIKLQNLDDIDLAALGLIDNQATVNIIEDHIIKKKIKLELPKTVTNVIKCKNPRCVTSVETNVPHVFHLIDEENKEYRCEYCDEIVTMNSK